MRLVHSAVISRPRERNGFKQTSAFILVPQFALNQSRAVYVLLVNDAKCRSYAHLVITVHQHGALKASICSHSDFCDFILILAKAMKHIMATLWPRQSHRTCQELCRASLGFGRHSQALVRDPGFLN
jgi:hypothetical protein